MITSTTGAEASTGLQVALLVGLTALVSELARKQSIDPGQFSEKLDVFMSQQMSDSGSPTDIMKTTVRELLKQAAREGASRG